MSRLPKEELEARQKEIKRMEKMGAFVLDAQHGISDNLSYTCFLYMAHRSALEHSGYEVQGFPVQPSSASVNDMMRIEKIWEAAFDNRVDKEKIFRDCYDVREKIAKLANLTEGELFAIANDMEIEFAVRRYANGMLEGTIDDMHKILDQALGKPIERVMNISKTVSPLEQLTESEIRKLLAAEEPEQGEIEVEETFNPEEWDEEPEEGEEDEKEHEPELSE